MKEITIANQIDKAWIVLLPTKGRFTPEEIGLLYGVVEKALKDANLPLSNDLAFLMFQDPASHIPIPDYPEQAESEAPPV